MLLFEIFLNMFYVCYLNKCWYKYFKDVLNEDLMCSESIFIDR